jgi:hypothetical protein
MSLEMNWPGIGALALGVFVGFLSFFMIKKSTTFTPFVLGEWLAVILGGVVIDFIGDKLANTPSTFGQYCTGLAIGLVLYIALGSRVSALKPEWLNT